MCELLENNFFFSFKQFKEMGGRIMSSESPKVAEQPTEKKKGLIDWINIVKTVNEEKDHWVTSSILFCFHTPHFYMI